MARTALPFLSVCAVFSCVQTVVWLPVFGIVNVHTDVDACYCALGLYVHRKKVCTGNWCRGKNPLPHLRLSHITCAFSVRCCTNWAVPVLSFFEWKKQDGNDVGHNYDTSSFWQHFVVILLLPVTKKWTAKPLQGNSSHLFCSRPWKGPHCLGV